MYRRREKRSQRILRWSHYYAVWLRNRFIDGSSFWNGRLSCHNTVGSLRTKTAGKSKRKLEKVLTTKERPRPDHWNNLISTKQPILFPVSRVNTLKANNNRNIHCLAGNIYTDVFACGSTRGKEFENYSQFAASLISKIRERGAGEANESRPRCSNARADSFVRAGRNM